LWPLLRGLGIKFKLRTENYEFRIMRVIFCPRIAGPPPPEEGRGF